MANNQYYIGFEGYDLYSEHALRLAMAVFNPGLSKTGEKNSKLFDKYYNQFRNFENRFLKIIFSCSSDDCLNTNPNHFYYDTLGSQR